MPCFEVGLPILLHHVLATLPSDFLSPPLSHPMHQGCPVQLWPCYQVTTPHRPGHLRTSVCPNYLTHLTHSQLSTLSIHCIIFIPIGTILSLPVQCVTAIIFFTHKKYIYIPGTPEPVRPVRQPPDQCSRRVYVMMTSR